MVQFLLALIMSMNIWASTERLDTAIDQKQNQLVILQHEVEEAEKQVGLAETMGYVEKIGLIQQLQDQIADLEAQKAALEAQ